MILIIDTTSQITKIGLMHKNVEVDTSEWQSTFNQSEELLIRIAELLQKNDLKNSQLNAIAVNTGPGSYTGIRIGVTTANAIAFALNIPVIATDQISNIQSEKFVDYVLPIYAGKPHITSPKKSD